MRTRNIILMILSAVLILFLCSCDLYAGNTGASEPNTDTNEEKASSIVFDQNKYIFTGDPDAIASVGSSITILRGGKYELSGKLEGGNIIIDIPEEEEIFLVLRGIEIKSGKNMPIYIKSAREAILEACAGTENFLIGEGDEGIAVYSCVRLTIIGNSSLLTDRIVVKSE